MGIVIAVMDQISGRIPVRIGTVQKAGGNVLIMYCASLTLWCVMEADIVLMNQMSGL